MYEQPQFDILITISLLTYLVVASPGIVAIHRFIVSQKEDELPLKIAYAEVETKFVL